MPTVHSQAAGLAASDNGRWLAWSEPGRLRVRDLSKPMELLEVALELEPPFELAVSATKPERLLVLRATAGSTVIRVFALPELREIVGSRFSLKGETRLAAMCGSVAVLLGGTESLIAVDLAKLGAAPLPVRGPIEVVAQMSSDQVLVAARGKFEAWSLAERRPTHRLGLALPRGARLGGVMSSGRLLWMVSTGAPDTVSLFRLSDGKPLGASPAGGLIRAVAADPSSTTVVAAIQRAGGAATEPQVQLVALDLETQAHRVLGFDRPIAAFCLVGSPVDAVAVLSDHGSPVLLPLAFGGSAGSSNESSRTVLGAVPDLDDADTGELAAAVWDASDANAAEPAAAAPDDTAGTAEPAPDAVPADGADNDLDARLSHWRAQVQAAVSAAPPRPTPQSARGARVISDEPRSRSRAELYAWGQLARSRMTTAPPPPPQGWRLTDLAVRFKLDMPSKSLLALLYASWLDGEGHTGVPVGVVARALGNDEAAWVEALAQGRIGRMGWLICGRGRTRLRGVVGRFLDDAQPRVALVTPTDQAVAQLVAPAAPALWRLPDPAALEHQVRDLAERLNAVVATIDVTTLAAARLDTALAARLLEARLHGALPILVGAEASPFEPRLLEGPMLIASPLPAWRALPVWPAADGGADDGAGLRPGQQPDSNLR